MKVWRSFWVGLRTLWLLNSENCLDCQKHCLHTTWLYGLSVHFGPNLNLNNYWMNYYEAQTFIIPRGWILLTLVTPDSNTIISSDISIELKAALLHNDITLKLFSFFSFFGVHVIKMPNVFKYHVLFLFFHTAVILWKLFRIPANS